MNKTIEQLIAPFTPALIVVALDNLRSGRDTWFLARLAESQGSTLDRLMVVIRDLRSARPVEVKALPALGEGITNGRSAVWVGPCAGKCGFLTVIRAKDLRNGPAHNVCGTCADKPKIAEAAVVSAIQVEEKPAVLVAPTFEGDVAPIQTGTATIEELPAFVPPDLKVIDGGSRRPSRNRRPRPERN